MGNTVDTNGTSLSFCEETTPKVLPGSPIWYALEPNSYSDFGSNFSTMARSPITVGRQKKKGSVTDMDCPVGFNHDFLHTGLNRILQGLFYADIKEKKSTAPYNGTQETITGVTTSNDTYTASAGTTLDDFLTKNLVLASGFGISANNGLKTVVSSTSTTVVVSENLVDEPAPPSTAKIEVVGVIGASGDITLTASATSIVLGSTLLDFTTLGLNIGEWIFIGGDTAGTAFATGGTGYARIKSITANAISLDKTTFSPSTDTGAAKTIQIFFGYILFNENTCEDIIKRYYRFERKLICDGVSDVYEYIKGCYPNQMTLNCPTSDKLNIDMSFIGIDSSYVDTVETGTHNASIVEDAINTSSEVYRIKMELVSATLNQPALFAHITDFNLSINNNVTSQKAIGVLGSIDASLGDFEVTGSMTAYFVDMASLTAFRSNSDVSLDAIFAYNNKGFIADIPLMTLSKGSLKLEKDKPITIPIDSNAFENSSGYTLLFNWFSYLPSVAMPV